MSDYQITAVESENTKIKASKTVSLNAGIKISVFGITLMAELEKGDGGYRTIVCPASENPGQSVSLKDICNSAGVSEDVRNSVDRVLKDFLGFTGGIEQTTIDVNQAFYYYSSYDSDKSGDINHEYAFSLGMTNNFKPAKPKEAPPFEIRSISFSLWNSTRQKVLEAMGMTTVDKVLEKFS